MENETNKRLNRKSYILSILASFGVLLVLNLIILTLLELTIFRKVTDFNYRGLLVVVLFLLWSIYVVFCVIRRLHDIGRSGRFAALFAIPLINIFLVLLLCIPRSKKEDNKWGKAFNNTHIFCLPHKSVNNSLNLKHQNTEIDNEVAGDASFKDWVMLGVKAITIVILVLIFLLVPLGYTKAYNVSSNHYMQGTEARQYLEQNNQKYKDCKYSAAGLGSSFAKTKIMLALGYYRRINETDTFYNSYLEKTNAICSPIMAKYETSYDNWANSYKEQSKSEISLLGYFMKNQPQEPNRMVDNLSPTYLDFSGNYIIEPTSVIQ